MAIGNERWERREGASAPLIYKQKSFLKESLWKALLALSLAAGMGIGVSGCKEKSATEGKAGFGGRGPQGPVAVIMGTVEQKDVPIYRDGLGTVQAFNTVTVRSRVD